jgi:hypothetical protein
MTAPLPHSGNLGCVTRSPNSIEIIVFNVFIAP